MFWGDLASPPRSQATSRSPSLLGLTDTFLTIIITPLNFAYFPFLFRMISKKSENIMLLKSNADPVN